MDNYIDLKIPTQFHNDLMTKSTFINNLNKKQGFTLATIKKFKIGFDSFTQRLSIPIIENNICFNIKLYSSKNKPKYFSFKDKNGNSYGKRRLWGLSQISNSDEILICAGEKDRIIAEQNGFVSVCSTTGERNWNNDWNIYFKNKTAVIIYDNDDTGQQGAIDIASKLIEYSRVKIIDLSSICIEKGEDLQDYFVKYQKSKNDLLHLIKSTEFYNLSQENSSLPQNISEQRKSSEFFYPRGTDLKKARNFFDPEAQKEYFKLKTNFLNTIGNNFPNLVNTASICLSILLQLRINEISNPFSLMLVGQPASSKTTVLDFFKTTDITYYTDKFTPASFVSNNASKKSDELSKIDMLPQLKGKVLITPELAPLFSKEKDSLMELFGILTRILDGTGLMVNSGNHGKRGYEGKYLFMWLGASTPVKNNVWQVMGNMGARIFFYNIPDLESDNDITAILEKIRTEKSYSQKIKDCQKVTNDLINFIWSFENINWNPKSDELDALKTIVTYAELLAKLRGVIENQKDDYFDDEPNTIIEKPIRLSQLLINFAKGIALLDGRNSIQAQDLPFVTEIALNSCPEKRRLLINGFIKQETSILDTFKVQKILSCSDKTANKYMKDFAILKIGTFTKGFGHSPSRLQLLGKYDFIINQKRTYL